MRRWLPSGRAQGLIEFVVIFPIFAIMLFAVIDGGLVMGRYNGVNHAATVGARFGAVQPAGDPASAAAAVVAQTAKYAPGTALDYGNANRCDFSAPGVNNAVCVQWLVGPNGENPGDIGSTIRVAVKYHYKGLTPLVKGVGGWNITACIAERQEQVVTMDPNDPTYVGNSGSCSGAGVPPPTNTPIPTNTPVPPTSTRTPVPPTNTPAPSPTRRATSTPCRRREDCRN